MKKNIFWTLVLLVISFQAFGQVQNVYLDELRFEKRVFAKAVKTIDYSDIKGSPYWINDFVMSKIYFRKDSVFKIGLRYNVFDQSMEYELDGVVYAISNPDIIEKIEMDNSVFIYYYNLENPKFDSYYELLASGKTYLLAKKEIAYRKAEPQKAIVESEPAKFIIRKDTYYVVIGSALPVYVKNKKALLGIFSDQKEKMQKFIKEEKISCKKSEDLIKLVEYYNNL